MDLLYSNTDPIGSIISPPPVNNNVQSNCIISCFTELTIHIVWFVLAPYLHIYPVVLHIAIKLTQIWFIQQWRPWLTIALAIQWPILLYNEAQWHLPFLDWLRVQWGSMYSIPLLDHALSVIITYVTPFWEVLTNGQMEWSKGKG